MMIHKLCLTFYSSAYSYYVEVSADDITWTRVVDYHAYLCRSWQKLYFAPIVAKYVIKNKVYYNHLNLL